MTPSQILRQIDQALDVSLRAKGAVMLTRDGNIINPLDPDPITVDEVAHVLANFCRYGGHCPRHYSVAQHSIMVSLLIPQTGNLPMLGLMHDAHEAYFGDWPKPVKNVVPGLGIVEDKVEARVRDALGLPLHMPDEVKAADLESLAIEMRWLWAGRVPREARTRRALLAVRDLTPDTASAAFLARYAELADTKAPLGGTRA